MSSALTARDLATPDHPAAPLDIDALATLVTLRVELPSWAFRGPDPRFSTHVAPDAPRTAYEMLADAAAVHRYTGITPGVGLHLPVDRVDDHRDLSAHAAELGLAITSVAPEVNLGHGLPPAVCHPDPQVRDRALAHLAESAQVAEAVGAGRLVLRFVDDSPYPGHSEAQARHARMAAALRQVGELLPDGVQLVVEHTVVEARYTANLPDWEIAYAHCLKLGDHAQVLVDPTHCARSASVDVVVERLNADGRLGGLVLRSPEPAEEPTFADAQRFELFLALADAVQSGAVTRGAPLRVPLVLDPGANPRPGVLPLVRAVLAIQEAAAHALLLDPAAWQRAQAAGDRAAANDVLLDAYETDVTNLLAAVRGMIDAPTDPVEAHLEDCRREHRDAQRRAAVQRLVARRVATVLTPPQQGPEVVEGSGGPARRWDGQV